MSYPGENIVCLGLTLITGLVIIFTADTTVADAMTGVVLKFDMPGTHQRETFFCTPIGEHFSKHREIRVYRPQNLSNAIGLGVGKRESSADGNNDNIYEQNTPESSPLGWMWRHSNVGTYSSSSNVNDDEGERRSSPTGPLLPLDPERGVIFLR